MHLHRYYTGTDLKLKKNFWLHDKALLWQWDKVLRYREGQEVVLFDGVSEDRLYKITSLSDKEAHLEMVTEFKRKVPSKEIYLFWSLLKKDKNEWVLQKGTEIGVSHFVPIIAERSEKTGFNIERAQKIIIEASEQCGRSDIPSLREPIHLPAAIDEFKNKITLFVCEQNENLKIENCELKIAQSGGVLIGPEGGWSDSEKEIFKKLKLEHLNLHDFTLRAETAAILAASDLIQ